MSKKNRVKKTQASYVPPTEKETVTMKFDSDKFYRDPVVPLYVKGKHYEVERRKVDRWLKRGGVIVDDTLVESENEVLDDAPTEHVEPAHGKSEDDSVMRSSDLK